MVDENNKTPENTGASDAGIEKRKTVRRLLTGGGIVTGAGLTGGAWQKPVIDSVLLPAHGQTTAPPTGGRPSPTPGGVPTIAPTPQATPSPTP